MSTPKNLCGEVSLPPIIAVRTPITPESTKWVEDCNIVPKWNARTVVYDHYYCYGGINAIFISTCTSTSARAEETTEVSLEEFIKQIEQGYLEWQLNQ